MRRAETKTGRIHGSALATMMLCLLLSPLSGHAAEDEDSGPRQLTCTFESGTSVSYENGTFTSKPASPLRFSLDKIDLEGQSADLTAGQDGTPAKVRIVRAVNANHFLEVVNEGFLNLTTIYDKDPKTGTYPAVHSRHLGLLGQPVFGQYSGFCKP